VLNDGAWYLGGLRCTFSMGGVVGRCCGYIQHNLSQGPILKSFVKQVAICPRSYILSTFFMPCNSLVLQSSLHLGKPIHCPFLHYHALFNPLWGPFSPLPIFWILHNLTNIFPSCLFTFITNTTHIICPTLLFLLLSIILLHTWFWWG